MEELREYWERFLEWFLNFIKSRWIRIFVFLSMITIAIVGLIYSIKGTFVHESDTTPDGKSIVYGQLSFAIVGTIFCSIVLIWMLVVLIMDPSETEMRKKLKPIYKRWKLWYWMPTLYLAALLEWIFRLFLIIIEGQPLPNNKNEKTNTKTSILVKVYSHKKLWYWIPTLGLAALIEYFAVFNSSLYQNHKSYFWDIILVLFIIEIIGLIFGVIAYNNKNIFVYY